MYRRTSFEKDKMQAILDKYDVTFSELYEARRPSRSIKYARIAIIRVFYLNYHYDTRRLSLVLGISVDRIRSIVRTNIKLVNNKQFELGIFHDNNAGTAC